VGAVVFPLVEEDLDEAAAEEDPEDEEKAEAVDLADAEPGAAPVPQKPGVDEQEPERTFVVIDEVDLENWGIGGESIAARRAKRK
jgi:hypothetical protein